MTDGRDTLSKRYRELAREEPPSALDGAILAASRRAVAARPSLSRRWAVPVSIAAVLVLTFGLTLEMEHEKPGVSTSLPAAPPASPPAAEAVPMAAPRPEPAPIASGAPAPAPKIPPASAAKLEAARAVGTLRSDAPSEINAAPAMERRVVPAQAAEAPAAPPAASAPSADYNAAPAAAAPARAKSAASAADSVSKQIISPEQELERIARLRSDGLHDEADRALEDFRRRYPGYRIADAMWERVKPR